MDIAEGERVTDPVGETDIDLDGVDVADHVKEARADVEGEPEPDREMDGEAETERVTVPVGDTVCDLDPVGVALTDLETVPVPETLGDLVEAGVQEAAERVAVTVFDTVIEGEEETEGEPVVLTDPVADTEPEALTLTLADTEADPVTLTELVPDPLTEELAVGETLALGVGVAGEQIAGRALSSGPIML